MGMATAARGFAGAVIDGGARDVAYFAHRMGLFNRAIAGMLGDNEFESSPALRRPWRAAPPLFRRCRR